MISDSNALQTLDEWRKNPAQFVTDVWDVTPAPWQKIALDGLVNHDRIAIRSGNGTGKTCFLAWSVLWFLVTHYPAKIACTAPSAHQLADVLWPELGLWLRRMPEALREQFVLTNDRLQLVDGDSFATARTARKETPEVFQGLHAENLLFIADEASGVDDVIFEVGAGSMSTPGAKTILTGNPMRASGFFYDTFNRNADNWYTIKVSALDVSMMPYADVRYPDEIAATYGRDSNVYRVRVLGEFPTSEDDVLIPMDLLEAAQNRQVSPSQFYAPVWGLDVARFGDDRTALCKRQGNVVLEPVKQWHGHDLMTTCGRIVHEYRETPDALKPGEILVDSIGIGAGVVDRLYELGLPVRGVNVAEKASDSLYQRLRDELWWKARKWLEGRNVRLPRDEGLISELISVKYSFSSTGRLVVESKKDMKARGQRSPDKADSFVLTFAVSDTPHAYDAEMDELRRSLYRRVRYAMPRYPHKRFHRRSWKSV